MPELEILLLAAGKSNRMGTSKALLDWQGMPLITFQIQKLQKLDLPITVVLGGYADQIKPLMEELKVSAVFNPNWTEGMGTSLAFGIQKLLENRPQLDGFLLFLLDQPLIEVEALEDLLEKFARNPSKILVSNSDAGWSGPPAIFPKKFFAELQALQGDEGAKPLIKKHKNSVIFYSLAASMADMDTPEAYQQLLKKATPRS